MKTSFFLLLVIFHLQGNSQSTFKISSGTFFKTNEEVFIVSENTSLFNDGNFQQSRGNGRFKFTGDVTTTISGKNTPAFTKLFISKTGSARLNLQQHISVIDELNFSGGLLDLTDFTIDLGSSGRLTGENEHTHTIGKKGYIQIVTDLNAPNNSNPGNLGAIFSSPQVIGITTIRRGHQSPASIRGDIGILRYYDIRSLNNIELNSALRFSYLNAELNGRDENKITLWRSFGTNDWSDIGFHSKNITSNYLEKAMGPAVSNEQLSLHVIYCIAENNIDTRSKQAIAEGNWKTWPNPVHDNLWVNISSPIKSKTTIKVFDERGALIRLLQYDVGANKGPIIIDMKKMIAGTYLIVASWDNGKMQKTMKVVKM